MMWSEVLTPILQAAGLALLGFLINVLRQNLPRLIDAFEKRTGLIISEQNRTALDRAADTGAGLIETKLHQGILKIADVNPGNPVVQEIAKETLARVPTAAAAENTTPTAMAHVIVGRADTSPSTVKDTVHVSS